MAGVNQSLCLSRSDLKVLHIVPGMDDVANGMVVVAKLLAKEQGEAEVVDLNHEIHESGVEEVWVHGMWLPKEWLACWRALRAGKRLVRMTHGSLSPLYLKCQSPFKKWLVGPIERWCLRRCSKIVATCEAEAEWIRAYEPRVKSIEVTDIKRFFNLNPVNPVNPVKKDLHLLYLGRRHPLKGVEYLEAAVRQIQESSAHSASLRLCVKYVSSAFGDELERVWDWCDVLVLPTLSENFGLVIAEALERGKRVITTDGAPAWGENLSRVERVDRVDVSRQERKERKDDSRVERVDGGMWSGYGGRLIYLKGYRDGTDEERVELLKKAIDMLKHDGNMV